MNKVFVIAEAGVNHNGSLTLAKQLIDIAAESGADAVKFQSFKADKFVSKQAAKADYQLQSTEKAESQLDMLKKLELSEQDHHAIIAHCKARQIEFLSTPFDHESIDLLAGLGMTTFKIPSGEITNLPYLRHVGRVAQEVILSTGMADLREIEQALAILIQAGLSKSQLTVLHATTEYPCPLDEVNLRAMHTIAQAFTAAVALGASVIEKHFTLDKTMSGPDHKASLEPQELIAMVAAIRHIGLAMGDGIKVPSKSEIKNINVARKSIVALTAIKAGELFSEHNLTVKRPGNGISPMHWDDLVGQTATRNYQPDDLIENQTIDN